MWRSGERKTENGELKKIELKFTLFSNKNERLNWLTWILGGKTSRYK